MAGYEVPGAVEEVDPRLPLLAMVRQGGLSPELQSLFRKHAHKAPGKEPLVKKEDCGPLAKELQRRYGLQIPLSEDLTLAQLQDLLFASVVETDASPSATKEATRSAVAAVKFRSPEETLQVISVLGEGATGRVVLCRDKATGEKRALKVVHKKGDEEELALRRRTAREEVKHLQALDHPHVARVYQHFEDAQAWYLVLQYCMCGDLEKIMEDYREDAGGYGLVQMPVLFTVKVTYQVLSALSHVHGRGIMHLDIKGQNLMFQVAYRGTILPAESAAHPAPWQAVKEPHVVLVDFGTAQAVKQPGKQPVGTSYFMAPEVWSSQLTPKADIFSLGVVLFQLLGGKLPFSVPDNIDMAQAYWAMEPLAPWAEVPYVAPQCQEVCDSMLTPSVALRPKAEELLLHPLFAELHGDAEAKDEDVELPGHYAARLANFPGRDVLQKCLRMRLAFAASANQMPSFRRVFLALAGGSAAVAPRRLAAALAGAGVAPAQARGAVQALAEDGRVGWCSFVAALADLGDPKYEGFLRQCFDQADQDEDGLLGIEDLARLMHADCGKHAVLLQEYMVALCGHDSPGAKFEWSSFLRHFRSDPGERARDGESPTEAPRHAGQMDDAFKQWAGTLLDEAVQEMTQ
ncbi:unnamed protein product [Effrenium voratum]|uniref:Uncharacterized protein n=1 Tax=Effrenium voratum TaxID=2562239 RepID=A0AA36JGF3_9DINO|nr:unnamed protein product [Effrenium voratum]